MKGHTSSRLRDDDAQVPETTWSRAGRFVFRILFVTAWALALTFGALLIRKTDAPLCSQSTTVQPQRRSAIDVPSRTPFTRPTAARAAPTERIAREHPSHGAGRSIEQGESTASTGSSTSVAPLEKEQREWGAEESDPDWTQNIKTYLSNVLEAEIDSPQILKTVDCRETLCRVELAQSDLLALRSVELALQNDGRRFSYAFGDESQVIVFFRHDTEER